MNYLTCEFYLSVSKVLRLCITTAFILIRW